MAVMLRRQRDGVYRPCWYGEFKDENGNRKVLNLNVVWLGSPPVESRGRGDVDFEESRKVAIKALEKWQSDAKRKGRAAHLVERLIEEKTGQTVEHVRLENFTDRWLNDGREYALSRGYTAMGKAILRRFVAFIGECNPKARFLYQVTSADVSAFAKSVRESMSPKTYREHLRLLRPAFDRLLPEGASNPFRTAFPRRSREGHNGAGESVHRRPFSLEELQGLLETAREDAFMYPLVVTAVCTGMRRGDLCCLRWSAVDLEGGMLDVKTSKTGARVEVPIFEPLRQVLALRVKGDGSEYVFPEAAQMLHENPDGLTWRFKKLVTRAFEGAEESPGTVVPATEIGTKGLNAIRLHVPEGARRARMEETLRRYAGGESFRDIEKSTGAKKGTISNDLHAVEAWTGTRFVKSIRGPDMKAAVARVTRAARDQGQRAASVRDWHALRTTWVTLALSAGVPMELVRRVTGHATVDVVLRHYFRPGRDEFKAALMGALPDVLTGVKPAAKAVTPAEELAALAAKLAAGSASEADRARVRELAAGV